MYDPYQHAEELGVTILYRPPGNGLTGLYIGHRDGRPTVLLKPGMSAREERSTLAHELVHVEHDDRPTADLTWHARRERRCNRVAAGRLIERESLLQLASAYEDRGMWAIELGVSGFILDAYLESWPLPVEYAKEVGEAA